MFSSIFIFLFGFTVLIEINFSAGKKPANHYFRICGRNDPNLDNCIEKSIMDAKPNLIKGIPEINLPPLDPLFLSKVDFKEGSGNFKFTLSLFNASVTGLTRMTVENVKFDFKSDTDITLECTIKAPTLYIYGQYVINGRILVIPVDGKGNINLNFTRPTIKATLKVHTFINSNDQKKYLTIDTTTINLSTKGGRVHLSNLFNGDKMLGRTVNNFFNNNFQDLFASLKHLLEGFFSTKLKFLANIIFNSWPYDELLPQ